MGTEEKGLLNSCYWFSIVYFRGVTQAVSQVADHQKGGSKTKVLVYDQLFLIKGSTFAVLSATGKGIQNSNRSCGSLVLLMAISNANVKLGTMEVRLCGNL